jgi:hypothetical protein
VPALPQYRLSLRRRPRPCCQRSSSRSAVSFPSATRLTLTKLSARLLQGTHDKIVADLLVNEHGIPRKWIVIDKGR